MLDVLEGLLDALPPPRLGANVGSWAVSCSGQKAEGLELCGLDGGPRGAPDLDGVTAAGGGRAAAGWFPVLRGEVVSHGEVDYACLENGGGDLTDVVLKWQKQTQPSV